MKNSEKTEAAILDMYGNVLGLRRTALRSGTCHYYYQMTTDGTPVNIRTGKISRSQRNLEKAYKLGDAYFDVVEIDEEMLPKIARIVDTESGYGISDDALDYIDCGMRRYPTERAAHKAARELGYSHYVTNRGVRRYS